MEEADVAYMVSQLEEMIPRLEAISGRRFSQAKFEEMLLISRDTSVLWGEVLATMKARPAPMSIFDAFVHLADGLGFDFGLLKEVQQINRSQREHLMRLLKKELWVIQGKRIAVWGLAFKPGTDDVREAPSLYFVPALAEGGAELTLWDPIAGEKFEEQHAGHRYADSPLAAAAEADAVLVLTDWPHLQEVDLEELRGIMACPIVIDGRNVFDPADMAARGFVYHSMGR
jgi:UDPglucose 6-dehydrogenase